jgi:hypothetical protein
LYILLLISILGDLVYNMIFFRNHICVKLAVDYSEIHGSITIVAFRTMTYVYVCLYRRLKRVYSYLNRRPLWSVKQIAVPKGLSNPKGMLEDKVHIRLHAMV